MIGIIGVALLTIALASFVSPERCAGERPSGQQGRSLTEGCEITIRGSVMGREERPENLQDGDFALKLSTADYGVIKVVYSAFRLCHNEVGANVKEGDRIEVYGKVISKNRITVCLSKKYYIKKL